VKTIKFAHLDAAMRIVREPERPAEAEAQETGAAEAEQHDAVAAKAAAAAAKVRTVARQVAKRVRPRGPIR
jgi:hypothetical protein